MVGGIVVVVPVLVLAVGLLAGLLASLRSLPADLLPEDVADARLRDDRAARRSVAAGSCVVAGLLALGVWQREATPLVVAPLTGAAVHAALTLRHECTRPKPGGRLRSARLAPRTTWGSAPRVLTVVGAAAALVVVAACVGGVVVAGPWTDHYVWTTDTLSASGGLFPGGVLAGPVLGATAVAVHLTAAVLHRVPARPALPSALPWIDASLRRTSAHRVVRVTSSALVGTAGVLLVTWAHFTAVYGTSADLDPDPVANRGILPGPLDAWTNPLGTAGVLVVLAGVVVLALPPRGLRAPRATVTAA